MAAFLADGIVVLSKAFLSKSWPILELNALVNQEVAHNTKVISPLCYGVCIEEISAFSPLLGDRLSMPTSLGVPSVAAKLFPMISGAEMRSPPSDLFGVFGRIGRYYGARCAEVRSPYPGTFYPYLNEAPPTTSG
jgi:hypothetical protein